MGLIWELARQGVFSAEWQIYLMRSELVVRPLET